ncbi:hypothetical protein WG899_09210 [Paucibacter sp. AS339]|uniref:hypothetical protein n=1 Tax=Paucibacter hankyongi TaxID=3133434 RepID=UPI0030A16683
MTVVSTTATPAWRRRLLMAGLALSLAATAWVAGRDEEEVPVAPAAPRTARGAQALAPTAAAGAEARATTTWPPALASGSREGWPEVDDVVLQSWGLAGARAKAAALVAAAPAPAPAPEEAAPEPPSAPPLSYQLVGRMDEPQRPRIVLSNSLRTVVLAVGETLDQQWRLDAIGPGGAQFTWLPGGLKQSLAFN